MKKEERIRSEKVHSGEKVISKANICLPDLMSHNFSTLPVLTKKKKTPLSSKLTHNKSLKTDVGVSINVYTRTHFCSMLS